MEDKLKSVFRFIKNEGMMSQYEEYVRPKSVHEKIRIGKEKIREADRQRKPLKNLKREDLSR